MNNNWYKFDNSRQAKIIADGKVLVIKPNTADIIPMYCPVCEFPMKTYDDSLAFREFDCCRICELTFARPNIDKWRQWRPDKSSEQWQEYYQEKLINSKPKVVLK